MLPYGIKKAGTKVPGHQHCGICHPEQKNMTKRARKGNKVAVAVKVRTPRTKKKAKKRTPPAIHK